MNMKEPPKDALKGWRVYHDKSDSPEIRQKFGYENMLLNRRAKQWLEATGLTGRELETAVKNAFYEYHRQKPTYAEISKANNERWAWETKQKWRRGETMRDGLTKAEAELLLEHFDMANDPVAQGLWNKAKAVLDWAG